MGEYRLKPGRVGRAAIRAYAGIEKKFVDAFLTPDGTLKTGGVDRKVVGAYQKIEDAVVDGYKKVENAFVDAFLEKKDPPEPKTPGPKD